MPRPKSIAYFTCLQCKQVIAARPSTAKKQQFCSYACRGANRGKMFGPNSQKEKFLSHVNKTETCWLWTGGKQGSGYGKFYDMTVKKQRTASRVAYELFIGPIPTGLLVCHFCDVPICVNPDHLYLGTNQDNMQDMVRKGRHKAIVGDDQWMRKYPDRVPKGEACGNSKLTEEQVIEIRRLYQAGGKQTILAKQFAISQATVSSIVLRTTWKHLP